MARIEENAIERLTREWRESVISRLESLDRKLEETNHHLTNKVDQTRLEIVDLKLAAVKQAEIETLEKRLEQLEEFKTKAVQTIVVVQIVFGIIWATVSRFVWK